MDCVVLAVLCCLMLTFQESKSLETVFLPIGGRKTASTDLHPKKELLLRYKVE